MDDPLIRRTVVFLLALLPLVLIAWAGGEIAPSALDEPGLSRAAIAALPGGPAEAPLLATQVQPAAQAADDARARNAADPFFAGHLAPAAPFRFSGSGTDYANARDCLALAAMAEAGPSEVGQRAVIQVVLNRVRHPAFAHTVCGVVFEGAERATGCQFTFTCDGSLTRRYGDGGWAAARMRAEAALNGAVFAAVGNATHYHTDWVYPAWSPQLVKLAQVETHLFYRWPGVWGGPHALRMGYRGGEPSLAALMSAGPDPQPTEAALDPGAVPMPPLPGDTPKVTGGQVVMRLPSGRANFVTLAQGGSSAAALGIAHKLCGASGTCRVLGWTDRALVPAAFPLPPAARAGLQFSYSRDPVGTEIVLYNCDSYKGLPREQCIPRGR